MEPIAGVEFLQCDLLAPETPATLKRALGGEADLVLSDMAAPTTGHRETDHIRTLALFEAALDLAEDVLKPGGAFVGKVFQGGATSELLTRVKKRFAEVKHVKPPASRAESVELYLVALGFKGPARAVDLNQGSPIASGAESLSHYWEDSSMAAYRKQGRHARQPQGGGKTPRPHSARRERRGIQGRCRIHSDQMAARSEKDGVYRMSLRLSEADHVANFREVVKERSWGLLPPTLTVEKTSMKGWERSGTHTEKPVGGGGGTVDFDKVREALKQAVAAGGWQFHLEGGRLP